MKNHHRHQQGNSTDGGDADVVDADEDDPVAAYKKSRMMISFFSFVLLSILFGCVAQLGDLHR